MTVFSQFVKDNYDKVKQLPSKERFKKLGMMYQEQKKKMPKKM